MAKFQATPKIMAEIGKATDEFHAMPDGADKEEARAALQFAMSKLDPPLEKDGPLDSIWRGTVAALDYGSGLVRTPILMAGAPKDAQAHDLARAVNPFDGELAPGHEEYRRREANRTGVPLSDGELLSKKLGPLSPYAAKGTGGLLRPEEGGALDFHTNRIGDLAFDTAAGAGPLQSLRALFARRGLVGQSASALRAAATQGEGGLAARAAQFGLDPLGNTVQGAGKKIYGSVFADADREAARQGARPLSETLLANDGALTPAVGTAAGLNERAKAMLRKIGGRVDDAVQSQENNPKALTVTDHTSPSADDFLESQMGVGPNSTAAKKVADSMRAETDGYGSVLTPSELNDLKKANQNIARSLKGYDDSAAAATGNTTSYVRNKLEAQISGGAHRLAAKDQRLLLENALDRGAPGVGGSVYADNQKLASLLSGQDELQKLADAGLVPMLKSTGTAALAAGGLGASQYGTHSIWPYLAAAGAGAATLPITRTAVGGGLARYGKLLSQPVRARLMENQNEPPEWTLLNDSLLK